MEAMVGEPVGVNLGAQKAEQIHVLSSSSKA
jgi:hypothetical protein